MMELNYKRYGENGPDLIILHGLFGMLDNWATLGGKFAARYRMWLVDQRNHGKSGHSEAFDYDLLAEDLLHFMQKHNMEKAYVLGHSMGGKTAMQFAFHHPEKVEKLIVADIAPKAYGAHHDKVIDALQSLDLKQIGRRSDAEEKLAEKLDDAGEIQFLLKNLTREPEGYRWKMNLDSLVENYDKIIGGVDAEGVFNGPTLFIRGGRSRYIEDSDIPAIREQFPQAEFVTLPGIGHWVHAEAPVLFEEAVVGFLG